MKNKVKNKSIEKIKILIAFCIVITIALIIIITSLENISTKEEKISDEQIEIEIQKQQQEQFKQTEESVVINKLSQMGERDRIEYYFSQFISAIESKNYQKAYDMLYDEYKSNYFPSLTDFEKYAKKTFPKMISVEHTNFERNGELYILFIEISDSLSGNKTDSKEMKFVIREDELNGYIMSFSVI